MCPRREYLANRTTQSVPLFPLRLCCFPAFIHVLDSRHPSICTFPTLYRAPYSPLPKFSSVIVHITVHCYFQRSASTLPHPKPNDNQAAMPPHPGEGDQATSAFFNHSSAKRINTDAVIATALKQQYPNLELVIIPTWGANLLSYAADGHATSVLIEPGPGDTDVPSKLVWKGYVPPARRIDGSPGGLAQDVSFGKFMYKWQDAEFILYLVSGRDGTAAWAVRNSYLLTSDMHKADALIIAAGKWTNELRDEVWVFDGGSWLKSAELYQSVMKSSWDAVILDPAMKKAIIRDHTSFFDSRDTYQKLKVPWKRGVIYYGPPGNGKTISIKAMMNTFYKRKDPIPALYVRNFVSVGLFPVPSPGAPLTGRSGWARRLRLA